ncbi:1,4-dihydroxy-2-naphthoate octaprenyltransferase [Zeaxanthinibacter enoshimensis]|uniref:1,4-dihydroxy-2-naphthoate octaprenyltransferase n=1 Tax=Zeaxanthinibacter enoshimensis TaxID=392009 RepID=A0A4V3D3X1_9FLAO|nr:1,4-dihydroxy-2-naphthoate octaprenyltransferase [Zeaxanthinibacter enoshimensis]TDQ31563.1 1,4-dihydroxy-2-naphthoate octaprenyltransferase [Zeaxanthinibacter enoshimensis]
MIPGKTRSWFYAARLRTLPLSLSGILMGTALAAFYHQTNTAVFILALLTTVGLQVTSNFANDYGDGVRGTDNEDRIGPKRALQAGMLSRAELKKGIIISVVINIVLITLLLSTAFTSSEFWTFAVFLGLGLASIWAAIRYTVGASAYGYRGLGDLFVFLFFGLLSVLGTLYLYTQELTMLALLPAVTIGALSTAVLNLNNMRDFHSDKKAGKNTLVVKLGLNRGKIYHFLLLGTALLCMVIFAALTTGVSWTSFYMLAFIPLALHTRTVSRVTDPLLFDPELKKLALSTFLLAFLCFIAFNYFL